MGEIVRKLTPIDRGTCIDCTCTKSKGGGGSQSRGARSRSIIELLGGGGGTGGGGGGPRCCEVWGELYMVGLTGRKGLGPAMTQKHTHAAN